MESRRCLIIFSITAVISPSLRSFRSSTSRCLIAASSRRIAERRCASFAFIAAFMSSVILDFRDMGVRGPGRVHASQKRQGLDGSPVQPPIPRLSILVEFRRQRLVAQALVVALHSRGELSLAVGRGLLIELPGAQFGEKSGFFNGPLEAAQRHFERLVFLDAYGRHAGPFYDERTRIVAETPCPGHYGLAVRGQRGALRRWNTRYSVGSTTRVSNVAVTRPPITTTARGFWVSEPIPVEMAIGRRPSAASNPVISTVRMRSSDPRITASSGDAPASRNWLKYATMTTPFSTACPNSAMKPIAADTERGMPVISRAKIPPISANGMLSRMRSALRIAPNASKSNMKMSSTDTGTMMASRAIARSWFSNSPDQVTL